MAEERAEETEVNNDDIRIRAVWIEMSDNFDIFVRIYTQIY